MVESKSFNRGEYETLQKDISDLYRVCLMRSSFGNALIRIYPAPFGIFSNKKSLIVYEGEDEKCLAMFKAIETEEDAKRMVMRGV
jgi:hypothetical protein